MLKCQKNVLHLVVIVIILKEIVTNAISFLRFPKKGACVNLGQWQFKKLTGSRISIQHFHKHNLLYAEVFINKKRKAKTVER